MTCHDVISERSALGARTETSGGAVEAYYSTTVYDDR